MLLFYTELFVRRDSSLALKKYLQTTLNDVPRLSFRGKGAEARVETRVKRASGKITLLPANVNVAV